MSLSNKDTAADTSVAANSGTSTKLSNQLATYRVYIVTWNVGTRFPDNISLRNLLGISNSVEDHHLPDIYAIGLQETNVQPQQQVLGLFKEDPWTDKAKKLLKDYDYVLIKSEQMQGLLISIFVRRQHVPHLRDIEPEFTRTGFGGIWGNKGAVSVRFNLYGCALTFVVAHLAAHDHHLDERIEDFKQIMDNHHYHVPRYREIYDHDYVFLFGDLNFRLMGEDTAQEVRDKVVNEEALEELMKRDQLSYVRQQTQEAFQLLQERKPAFPPTFKFHEGTSEYNLKRRPAWTDRILYSVQPNNKQPNANLEIEQCAYKSQPGYNISDHKPVTSEFTIKLYPNYRATCVEFKDIGEWKINEENTVEYKKPLEFKERDFDWIGIFPVNYSSLKDYVSYEYVKQPESPPSTPDTAGDPFWDNNPSRHRHGRHRHHNKERVRRQQQANDELVRLDFDDDAELKDGEEYVLIYFHNTGLRGVTSIAGISNVFKAQKRSSTPNPSNID
ncbi:inositol polyphosphate 5-phosphatase K [Haematobia irritans]|uniref:inositol polyphosphate 5-phosphatase K n=1 Tax=Haematobia irritans TaxID=7368 RepID=UPI003F506AE9